MSLCVFEHCDREGGHLELNFTADSTGQTFVANVKMCTECYETLWAVKRNTGELPTCDILFSTAYESVDFGNSKLTARVQSMRCIEERSATMQQHELWAKTINSKAFENLLRALDGKRTDEFTLGDARKVVEPLDRFFSALDFMTWRNNAYHAGILIDTDDDTLFFDENRLAEVRALPVSKAGWITVDCCFDDCKG